jgi:hypothetical protein
MYSEDRRQPPGGFVDDSAAYQELLKRGVGKNWFSHFLATYGVARFVLLLALFTIGFLAFMAAVSAARHPRPIGQNETQTVLVLTLDSERGVF